MTHDAAAWSFLFILYFSLNTWTDSSMSAALQSESRVSPYFANVSESNKHTSAERHKLTSARTSSTPCTSAAETRLVLVFIFNSTALIPSVQHGPVTLTALLLHVSLLNSLADKLHSALICSSFPAHISN